MSYLILFSLLLNSSTHCEHLEMNLEHSGHSLNKYRIFVVSKFFLMNQTEVLVVVAWSITMWGIGYKLKRPRKGFEEHFI